MKNKPLYQRIIYGFLIIIIWLAVTSSVQGHWSVIETAVFTFLMICIFSVATDIDIGFSKQQSLALHKELIEKSKNKEQQEPFDLMQFLRIRPRKIDEKYKKYASLNRRTFAATVDTCIAMVTISPIIELILKYSINVREMTVEELSAVHNNPDPEAKIVEFTKLLIESGKLYEFLLSSTLQIGLLILASAICWKIWSATPGKLLFRMKIVDADTEKPMTNRQIIIRALGYIPACAVFFIGILWISFNKRKQGWHDKMAGTVVIITSKNKFADISKEPAQPVV